jgi:DNA-binding ferritin-like protein (Dps family)
MIPKPTEDTITNLLVKELEKNGVKAESFPTISTPSGVRKPDIWCSNGGAYPIEAKFKESDLINAVAKVQNDYIKWFDVLGIKGGFAILYPEELTKPMPSDILMRMAHQVKFKAIAMFPPKDTRKSFTVYDGTLSEIGKILAEHVLAPPEYVEPSTDYIIKALRDSAEYITFTLKYLSGKELEDIFGGKEVFKNILQYEEQKYPVETLRLASAYLLVNQLLFYHVLSRRMPDKFPEIDAESIKKPADLANYFKNVLNVNYRTVFSYDVASKILSGFTDQIKAIISVIKGLSPEKVGGDLLGTIFHDLVPFQVRKSVAAFYTNVLAAELLAWLSIDEHDDKVADLAVGSGGLLVAAYRRKHHLLESERNFTEADHRRFVENELLGIDVMPFAANVAACHLALQSPEYFTNRVNIAIWDSTELEPGRNIPSIASLKLVLKGQAGLEMYIEPKAKAKGVVSLTSELPKEISLEKYDVIIMNPPFTRQERIPEDYKNVLFGRFKDYKSFLHGQMGYFGYFVFLADKFLEDNGRMALVLPATALHVRSVEGIRKLWSEKYHVEYIITTWHRLAFSESVVFREILLVAKKTKPSIKAVTKVCVLKKLPDKMSKAREVADRIKALKQDYEDDEIAIKVYPYSKFTADTTDWHRFISISNLKLVEILENALSSEKLIPLSQISEAERSDLEHFKFKDFHGFILNDAKRLQRKTDHWFLEKIKINSITIRHKKLIHTIEIPTDCLTKALRRFSNINTIDVTDNSDYLIQKWFDKIREMARYTLSQKELNALKPEVINSWKDKFERKKAHLLLARRPYLSSPGTCLIAFYSKKPTVGIDLWSMRNISEDNAKILALWLNSSINILQLLYMGVACEGPWMKLHDYMLDRLLVPNPKKLTKKEKAELLKTFEEIKDTPFTSITKQLKNGDTNRKTIDKTWLSILGYKGNQEEFLNKLYASTSQEIKIINELLQQNKD